MKNIFFPNPRNFRIAIKTLTQALRKQSLTPVQISPPILTATRTRSQNMSVISNIPSKTKNVAEVADDDKEEAAPHTTVCDTKKFQTMKFIFWPISKLVDIVDGPTYSWTRHMHNINKSSKQCYYMQKDVIAISLTTMLILQIYASNRNGDEGSSGLFSNSRECQWWGNRKE